VLQDNSFRFLSRATADRQYLEASPKECTLIRTIEKIEHMKMYGWCLAGLWIRIESVSTDPQHNLKTIFSMFINLKFGVKYTGTVLLFCTVSYLLGTGIQITTFFFIFLPPYPDMGFGF
jgi:hypothetical protein